ncbi:MAG: hypothetical protein PHU99_06430 [Candidatus Cloacimonetes bacterium]|jgi:hypothetical protein|nr:hypothetical protein [Candidatus Cloacimonadota bacterium]MDY0336482.1 hypothetical protein [Candidatus Cloacimonadaceae bacterium]MCB5270195.1 hypothetical protein [Candidatus Cloacimonadota bacterium]MCK9333866.1 hypothetical protein [Candidatus Cloacimonadota bacterium]MDD2543048.1 hypothetical protein [Candidatus Cloacimonadota bacterium]
MKRCCLLIVLTVLMLIPLAAQTGYPGLRYGMNPTEASAVLNGIGFTKIEASDNLFKNDLTVNYQEMELFFTETDSLVSWLHATQVPEGENFEIEEENIEALSKLHGDDYDYDNYYSEAYWRLDDYHYISAAYDESFSWYVIFYGDQRHPDYIPY